MKNNVFELHFDKNKGLLTSLVLCGDQEKANFIKDGRGLAEPHGVLWYTFDNKKAYKELESYQFRSFSEKDNCATAIFSRRGINIRENFVLEENLLHIKISIKNERGYPVYFKKEDCSFYMPFADSYDNSEICAKIRCHTHIAAFGENSYVQTERMGCSEYNIGVVLTKGSVDSYSQEDCWNSNNRGYFILNVSPFHLLNGETHEIEFVLFPHKGGKDFFEQAQKLTPYIHTETKDGYVLFLNEKREFTLTTRETIQDAKIKIGTKTIPCTIENNKVAVFIEGFHYGQIKVSYTVNGRSGEAYFFVSPTLEQIQDKRARFIVNHQQCLEKDSPLYGAYLIYDNEEKLQYFSFDWTDHNANRERMGTAVFLVKYVRKTGNKKVLKSLDLFTEFLLRECVEEDTGKAYNNIGKDASVTRLYNAPWVILYFCELYLLKREKRWIDLAIKMIILYYQNGGTKFYPNGIRFSVIAYAIRESGQTEKYQEVLSLFDEHIKNIIEKGTNYPPHEVNYEQTIVTPAVSLLLDQYLITKDEKYIVEAEKHLKFLIKFNGNQPDYRLNKVPIRYWDNYWFGKTSDATYGDTLPHCALVLSAHCFYVYGKVTGKQEWIDYGRQAFQSIYCTYNLKGEAYSAYVYPERVNGQKGGYFDPFANEQDGALYFLYKLTEEL